MISAKYGYGDMLNIGGSPMTLPPYIGRLNGIAL